MHNITQLYTRLFHSVKRPVHMIWLYHYQEPRQMRTLEAIRIRPGIGQ